MRIGIELEYWLVETDGSLAAADDLAAADEAVENEFAEPLLEVKTPPCDSVAEAAAALADRLERVRERARSRGKRLVPTGTPLADEPVDASDDAGVRIDVQRAVLGDDLEHARRCAGAHVHFEQCEPAAQLRALTALDPAFALVNASPYYRGRRVVTCARPHVYRRRCYRSWPELGQLWRYPTSLAEWRDRREARFEAFVEAAADRGVDRSRSEAAFSPDDAVWSPVRLRDDLGTVEWRAPDAAPPLDVCRLVADVVPVVERAVEAGTRIREASSGGRRAGADRSADGPLALPPFETLREHVDAAIERGLSAPRVRRHLSTLGLDVDSYRPLGARIEGPVRLDRDTARRLRKRCADRLDRDLRRLRTEGADALDADGRSPIPA